MKKTQEKEQKIIAIQVPAILEGVTRLKDGGVSLRFGTNEVSEEELATINRQFQKFGYLLFRPNEFKLAEIPVEDADLAGKSQSQRFRSVLFVYWSHMTRSKQTTMDFENFYRTETEKVITHFNGKLPPQI